MKIIVPMAGRGTRLRPHTLTTPKPLIPIAGKPIVQRLVEDIVKVCPEEVDEIAFVTGNFGAEIEHQLLEIAESVGAKCRIFYQDVALGTAHAILCAKEVLQGPVIVAFADTLFKADFKLNTKEDGIIWVQKVEDPSAFGVVKLDEDSVISDFIEKPQDFVSDLAIIGIYYFKSGEFLRSELQYLIDNDIKNGGEYQLTVVLENMKKKGTKFVPGQVVDWLDCGNKVATVSTNQTYLGYLDEKELVSDSALIENSVIIPPVYIGNNVAIKNCVIGPSVSIGNGTEVTNSIITNTIVQENTEITRANIKDSMLGNHVKFIGHAHDVSIGDYNAVKQ